MVMGSSSRGVKTRMKWNTTGNNNNNNNNNNSKWFRAPSCPYTRAVIK